MWSCVSCPVSQLKFIDPLLGAAPWTDLGDRSERPAPCTEDFHRLILNTVPLVPPRRTLDSGLLLAGHHISYGILVGTLKSRGRLVYSVIPLLLFL